MLCKSIQNLNDANAKIMKVSLPMKEEQFCEPLSMVGVGKCGFFSDGCVAASITQLPEATREV